MILIIDNYDSFTFNLAQLLQSVRVESHIQVKRHDEITIAQARSLNPDILIISPGPGRPDSAGISLDLIRTFSGKIPILGVCLGHQCIAQAYGGRVNTAQKLMHGKVSEIFHLQTGLFVGLPSPLIAARYHSLSIQKETLPEVFEVTAWTSDGEIMGIRHRHMVLQGLQFHPESFLTPLGKQLIRNFFALADQERSCEKLRVE